MKNSNARYEDRMHGKRFINLVRQSNDDHGTTSNEAQRQWMTDHGIKMGMTHVDDIILDGVTGSLPGNRDDLTELLSRKAEQDDFDVLLVQRLDRLTRGGTSHGFWFEHECTIRGITVIYPGDDLPEDARYSGLIKAAKFDAAQEQARSTGQRSVQGAMHAIEQGRNCVTARTPFGCDRLYLTSEGTPSFIIRSLADGRQHKLTHDTREIIDTLGQVGGGAIGHYRKQKEEQVLIVPGDPVKADVVREIFDLRYNQQWGGKRIAGQLNSRGILSPTGKGWSQRQVESIYENTIYCGVALGQRVTQGIYYTRGEHHPEAVDLDAQTLANCRHAPKTHRPPTDWLWQEQPLMKDFLPEALAAKARQEIEKLLLERWERRNDPTIPKRSTNKHKDSPYLLTGLLYATQNGEDLSGVLCGKEGRRTRYYRNRKGNVAYTKGSVLNRLIPAEPLEKAVLDLLRGILLDAPMLRDRIRLAMENRPDTEAMKKELSEARQEREALAKRVELILQTLDEASMADAKAILNRLGTQRGSLDARIQALTQSLQHAAVGTDSEQLADQVVAKLANLDQEFDSLPSVVVRNLLRAFVERIDVDMESKNAAVTLRLPPWALENGDWQVCLAPNSASSAGYETHRVRGARSSLTIHLIHADCRYVHTQGSTTVPPCYRCRRRKAA